ncbi:MAG: hypothetical protein K1X53_16530 [Candidatus Sumerlaeaceae bacterium]|nr:hypothetical protein [Candidatus Sumerlaeaceae bacterium]
MKIRTEPLVTGISGHLGSGTVVTYVRRGQVVARARTKPRNPRTSDQVTSRGMHKAAAQHWGTLAPPQFAAWKAYAARHFAADQRGAFLVYCQVQYARQAMGLPLGTDAPTAGPPPAPLAITVLPSANPADFRFRITHRRARVARFRVRFDLTPAMPSPGRTPRKNELRMIRHVGPDSFLPLQPTNSIYTIKGARFSIPPGARFGVRVTIVNPDGVPGPPLVADLFR